jgi:hypothetical protein
LIKPIRNDLEVPENLVIPLIFEGPDSEVQNLVYLEGLKVVDRAIEGHGSSTGSNPELQVDQIHLQEATLDPVN